jgi:hypothetical protein
MLSEGTICLRVIHCTADTWYNLVECDRSSSEAPWRGSNFQKLKEGCSNFMWHSDILTCFTRDVEIEISQGRTCWAEEKVSSFSECLEHFLLISCHHDHHYISREGEFYAAQGWESPGHITYWSLREPDIAQSWATPHNSKDERSLIEHFITQE